MIYTYLYVTKACLYFIKTNTRLDFIISLFAVSSRKISIKITTYAHILRGEEWKAQRYKHKKINERRKTISTFNYYMNLATEKKKQYKREENRELEFKNQRFSNEFSWTSYTCNSTLSVSKQTVFFCPFFIIILWKKDDIL